MEPDLRVLGIEARDIMKLGKAKQLAANEALWSQMGIARPALNRKISAAIEAACELVFPREKSWRARIGFAREVWRAGGFDYQPTTLEDPKAALA